MQLPAMQNSIDNADWITPAAVKLNIKELPDVPGYHVMIRPVSLREKTKGGIYLPDKVVDDISYLTTIGQVIKLGDLAYEDSEKFPKGKWCEVGDYVCYGKHTGQKFVYKGIKLLLLFDDQIIMRVEDPKYLDTTYNLSE
uniref:Co-chaperonin GroES n=1 Tax=uncultured virus TaxID=340016 RepID=A0A221S3S1_9VIRU|nr:co-chaperonin GroES [uncultured virus]